MKKLYSFVVVLQLLSLLKPVPGKAQFTFGNLVVVRDGATGQGSAPTSAGTALFLDEFTVSGTAGITIALPTTTSGSVNRIVGSGTATSEGLLSLSANGQYLTLGGYDAAVGTASVNSAATTDRVIARIDANGIITTTVLTTQDGTAANNSYTTNNFRSVISVDGSRYWTGGNGTASTGGVRTALHAGSTASVIGNQVSNTASNTRMVKIFNGQLYYSTGSGTNGIYKVGTGLPTTSGTASTLSIAATDPYDFVMLPRGGTNWSCYVATGSSGSSDIEKFSSIDNGANWTAQGSISTGTGSNNVYGLTGNIVAGNVVLYFTRTGSIGTLTDAAAFNATMTGTITTIATAPTNTVFRGIAFVPPFVLSIHLQNISAAVVNHKNLISWQTGHEDRGDYFELQRSSDAKAFSAIARIEAKGSESNYTYEDNQPLSGMNYYRLKMVDNGGRSDFSQIVSANTKWTNNTLLLTPNPVTDKLFINFQNAVNGKVCIADLSGKLLYTQAINGAPVQINTSSFAKGMYILTFTDEHGTQTLRFTK